MRSAACVTALGAAAMLVMIGYGFMSGGGWGEVGRVLALPWGMTTMLDIYIGLALFCAWIWFREASVVTCLISTVLALLVGNLFTCLYVTVALVRSNGDWAQFWMGDRCTSPRGAWNRPDDAPSTATSGARSA